jgi:hypothetical protein
LQTVEFASKNNSPPNYFCTQASAAYRVAMKSYDWVRAFRILYDKALQQYRRGNRDAASYFTPAEQAELASIGCRATELYDFAEDDPDLDWETALLITSARRDYFLVVQHGRVSAKRLDAEIFPAKKAELHGVEWLPRIILKARAKLRGELPDELMYCCGGDRAFLKKHDIHPADFLREVWAAGDDDEKIARFVLAQK